MKQRKIHSHVCDSFSEANRKKLHGRRGVVYLYTFSKVEKPAKYHVTHVCTVRKLRQAFASNGNRDDLLHSNEICIL